MTRWSAEEYEVYTGRKPPKKHKYNAKKTVIDGITFDSQKEAFRYRELDLLEKAGEIRYLQLQPRFTLLEGFTCRGKKIRKMEYVADFLYTDMRTGEEVVEDVKGQKTQAYMIKKKLFLNLYGERYLFREV